MDISFQVVSATGAVLVNDEKRSDEVHSLTAPDSGVYSFCFDNSFSTLAEKVVYVDLGLDDNDGVDTWLRDLGDSDLENKDLQIESLRVCTLPESCLPKGKEYNQLTCLILLKVCLLH